MCIVLVCLFAVGCSSARQENTAPAAIRVGVLPDQPQELLSTRYRPLLVYLENTVGVPFEWVPSSDYAHLLAQIDNHQVDFAYLGGVTFVKARARSNVVPLVMRREDSHFTSLFLVPAAHPAQGISDLEGGRLAFGSRLSTSGHLMPRYFLEQEYVAPESFFGAVIYTGDHDTTALAVRDGKVDMGVVNARIVRRMMNDGRLDPDTVRILWETPPYVDYVWATGPQVGKDLANRLRDAFLALDRRNPDQRAVLDNLDASFFLPASVSDFGALAQIMEQQERAEARKGGTS